NFYVAVVLCLAGLAWFAQLQYGLFKGRWRWRGGALLAPGVALVFSGGGHSGRASAATAPGERKAAVQILNPTRYAHTRYLVLRPTWLPPCARGARSKSAPFHAEGQQVGRRVPVPQPRGWGTPAIPKLARRRCSSRRRAEAG